MPNPTKTVTNPPRIKPLATREYGKPKFQAGGEVESSPPILPPPQPTAPPLPPLPTANELAEQSTRQLDPRFWHSMGKPSLPPTHRQFNWRTGAFDPA
jgi:hypothetical protein